MPAASRHRRLDDRPCGDASPRSRALPPRPLRHALHGRM